MFVRVRRLKDDKYYVQVLKNVRVDGKIKQSIKHFGTASSNEELVILKKRAESFIQEEQNKELEKSPLFDINGNKVNISNIVTKLNLFNLKDIHSIDQKQSGMLDIFGSLYDRLNFSRIIKNTRKDTEYNKMLKHLVITRIDDPVSKRKSAKNLDKNFGIEYSLKQIYTLMDKIFEQEENIKLIIKDNTFKYLKGKVDVLFFDVTTLYFESFESDELRANGYSKDAKFKEVQVVLSLVVAKSGLPISYDLFPGDVYEGHTLIPCIEKLKQEYDVKDVIITADRGMLSDDNLKEMEKHGFKYIVGGRLKSMPDKIKKDILSSERYKFNVIEEEPHWIKEFDYNEDRRLIVGYSSKRAEKDAYDRQKLIERLIKKFQQKKQKNIPLSAIIPNKGTMKYLKVDASDTNISIDNDKIETDAKWDGIYGVITNVKDKDVNFVISKYRELWQVEESFRINKHDLKMRPIFHWKPRRIRSHISICFMAFTLIRFALFKLKVLDSKITLETLKEELKDVYFHTVKILKTTYKVPKKLNEKQKFIYDTFEVIYSDQPHKI